VAYGLTSLPQALVGPAELEHFWRSHWTIKNRAHYVRDETRSVKTAVSSGPALAPKRWPLSAARSCHCCASTAGAILLQLLATMPTIRNAYWTLLVCPYHEIALAVNL